MTRKRPKTSSTKPPTSSHVHRDHHHHHNYGEERKNENDDDHQVEQQLIPGLPDHISHLFLSKLHPSTLYSVSLSWRRFLYSPHFPPFLSLYSLLTPNSSSSSSSPINISFSNFDPISSQWQPLPQPDPPLHLLLTHPSYISRHLPIQSLTAAHRLIMVAATTNHLLPTLRCPLIFNPHTNSWLYGPPLQVPRRWCAAGSLSGSIYIASGVGTHFTTDASTSAEKWVISGDHRWVQVRSLRDGRFSRDAINAVGWRGRLCVVNVKAKEGVIYDAVEDKWVEMTEGMVAGWSGPATAMDEEVVYVVDEEKGVLKRYEEGTDMWMDVLESERFRGAQNMAAGGGRVCVVCGGGGIAVVDVVMKPARMLWVVEPPPGFKVIAVHVLPRMSRPV